jgi:hypothetical protein
LCQQKKGLFLDKYLVPGLSLSQPYLVATVPNDLSMARMFVSAEENRTVYGSEMVVKPLLLYYGSRLLYPVTVNR